MATFRRSKALMIADQIKRKGKKRMGKPGINYKMGKPRDEIKENGRMIDGQFYPKMLTGGQAKLDKNKNNKIDAQDFKILRAEKAKGRGMGLQDEKVKPGKVMKAKRGSGLDLPVIKSVKPELKKNPSKTNPNKKRFSTMEEMRRAKGFKPGETPAEFNKRKALIERSIKAAKATRLGKIIAPIALTGVAAAQYLKSKMKKKKESKKDTFIDGSKVAKSKLRNTDANVGFKKMGGGLAGATARLKAQGKMGGGMMKRPMGYDRGGMYLSDEKIKKVFPEKDAKRRANISQLVGGDRVSPMKKERFTAGQSARRRGLLKKLGKQVAKTTPLGLGIKAGEAARKIKEKISKKMGGGMMNKPMGYRSGKSVKVKCKLGRNKPTKMY
tara:strand:- start:322 stop:1470 length:1149 start_codon:yes stop_codon:yes gene_type:complete